MARRRTKNQKIDMQRRKEEKNQRQKLIDNLQKEKEDLLKKLEEEKSEYRKTRNVRNLNIFKSTFKLLYPYCLLGIVIPIPVVISHGGFPFVIDSTKYYLEKTLDANYEGEIYYQEDYVPDFWDDKHSFPNKLTIISPWTGNRDGTKSRIIREYDVTYSDELVDTILASDYEKMEDALGNFSSEIMETTNDEVMTNNTYHLEGSLGTIDYDSCIEVPETEEDNNLLTKLEIAIFIFFSIIILKNRKFRYIKTIKEINNDYNSKKTDYNIQNKNISMKINNIDQKILAIKNKGVHIDHE